MSRLVVDNLTFRYPGAPAPALSQINLDVGRGEMVLVAGPSGCGKSTLALALSGLIPERVHGRMAGSVHLGGVTLSSLEAHEVARHIGMVFQDPASQLITPVVESEVAFGPENLALPRDEIRRRVEESLRLTGMMHMRHELTSSLSGGEKQRVAIAATLAMRPNVLVLDEPCSDLDPLGAQSVLGVLRRLSQERGMTVVLIEHRIDEVAPWVDRIVLLDRGRTVLDQPTRAAFVEPHLWDRIGVAVPEMVRLGHALPGIFSGSLPLSVDEAYEALSGSSAAAGLVDSERRQNECLVDDRNPVISWKGVSVSYNRPVLSDIELVARPGEWLTIAGANGSGKTSLVELAMGFRRPTSGSVTLNGHRVDPRDVSRQAREVGYLFQSAESMLFTSSVIKELGFTLRHRRPKAHRKADARTMIAEQRRRIPELLTLIELGDRADSDPFSLSAGQRERLAIAALLVEAPNVLVLDEPTTGQDEGHARAVLTFLEDLRRSRELTYVMVSHDMRMVANYATRLAVLAGGRVILDGPPAEVFARRELLAEASIVAPPAAELHSRLASEPVTRVSLSAAELLAALGAKSLAAPA